MPKLFAKDCKQNTIIRQLLKTFGDSPWTAELASKKLKLTRSNSDLRNAITILRSKGYLKSDRKHVPHVYQLDLSLREIL